MNSAIGIIFSNMNSGALQGLTQERPIAALPFGGRYRLLDFALSSMVNSVIHTVGVITPPHYRSLLDHLGAGKDWSLDRKSGGLFILPGVIHSLGQYNMRFSLKDLVLNREFLEKDFARQVIISSSDQVYNMDFHPLLKQQEETGADLTLVYKQSPEPLTGEDNLYLRLDGSGRVAAMAKTKTKPEPGVSWSYFCNIFVIRRELLLQILDSFGSIENLELTEVLAQYLSELRVWGYHFGGYIGRIGSVKDYFYNNMALLQEEIRGDLFKSTRPIRTKIRDNPPTRYGSKAQVKNSLISSGCVIEGVVENSILSRGVVVEEGCMVNNCVIMSKCLLGRNTVLENLILDKFVAVQEGSVLKGRPNQPMVISKKAVI